MNDNHNEKNIIDLKVSLLVDDNSLSTSNKAISRKISHQKISYKDLDTNNSPQELTDNYKQNINELKLYIDSLEKKLDDNSNSNKKLLINNNELKNNINS